ncbi:hypothetical protein B0H19DRAFT_1368958 [Mycena capillaripes]|nr:hypothetical protein B0H19DRAFT_1368958 [Mycena capillaripes]
MSPSENRLLVEINNVTLGVSIPGVILSFLLLAAIAYLQWHTVSRPHLDRVSFRLVIYALMANIVLGSLMFFNLKETSPGCSFAAFLGLAAPLFSACMFCCIAFNLQLVLVYGVNGNMMEKYYIIGAVILSGSCTIPPLVAGELGWYSTNGACWIRDRTPTVQLHWLIGTQSVPMLLMSAAEVLSVLNIVIFMIKNHRLRANTISQSTRGAESEIVTVGSSLPKHPIVKYRLMIMRIALYPLFSCFLSITACILDVYSVMHPNLTNHNIELRTTNLFIFSLRPVLYGLLAVTDPSFLRAVRSLGSKTSKQSTSQSQTATAHSYELAPMQLAAKYSNNSLTTHKKLSPPDCERGLVLTPEEEALQLRSESIGHQI